MISWNRDRQKRGIGTKAKPRKQLLTTTGDLSPSLFWAPKMLIDSEEEATEIRSMHVIERMTRKRSMCANCRSGRRLRYCAMSHNPSRGQQLLHRPKSKYVAWLANSFPKRIHKLIQSICWFESTVHFVARPNALSARETYCRCSKGDQVFAFMKTTAA
jgi:hypothetical protein